MKIKKLKKLKTDWRSIQLAERSTSLNRYATTRPPLLSVGVESACQRVDSKRTTTSVWYARTTMATVARVLRRCWSTCWLREETRTTWQMTWPMTVPSAVLVVVVLQLASTSRSTIWWRSERAESTRPSSTWQSGRPIGQAGNQVLPRLRFLLPLVDLRSRTKS